VPVQVKTVVLRHNAHEIEDMRRFADELGVGFRFDTLVTPCMDGNRNPCTARLSEEVSLRLDLEDTERRAAWADCLANRASLTRSKMFDCGAGRTSFHVSPDGKLALCLSDLPVYDLAGGSFEQGWNGPIRERREMPLPAGHACEGCTDLVFCGLCPPLARMETGSDLGVPAQLCALGKRRRRAIAEAS
jgi:radical SAM protein with 4Fe4S-binding SPASM domain